MIVPTFSLTTPEVRVRYYVPFIQHSLAPLLTDYDPEVQMLTRSVIVLQYSTRLAHLHLARCIEGSPAPSLLGEPGFQKFFRIIRTESKRLWDKAFIVSRLCDLLTDHYGDTEEVRAAKDMLGQLRQLLDHLLIFVKCPNRPMDELETLEAVRGDFGDEELGEVVEGDETADPVLEELARQWQGVIGT